MLVDLRPIFLARSALSRFMEQLPQRAIAALTIRLYDPTFPTEPGGGGEP